MIRALMILCLVFPGVARAGTPEQYRAASRVPMVPYAETVVQTACPYAGREMMSCAAYQTHTVWLTDTYPHTYYHEMGHLFDFGMPQSARTMFAVRTGDHRAWSEGELTPGSPATPMSERFADLYAACAQYGVNPPNRIRNRFYLEGYGGWFPTVSNYRYMCRQLKYYTPYRGEEEFWPVLEGVIPFPA